MRVSSVEEVTEISSPYIDADRGKKRRVEVSCLWVKKIGKPEPSAVTRVSWISEITVIDSKGSVVHDVQQQLCS